MVFTVNMFLQNDSAELVLPSNFKTLLKGGVLGQHNAIVLIQL